MAEHNPAVVIDNGTGYTKMGYSVRNNLFTIYFASLSRTSHDIKRKETSRKKQKKTDRKQH